MNVTEQDIKALKKTSSKGFLLFFIVFMPLVIIFFLVMAGINFWFCHKWASAGRLTISEVFCIWFQGISPSMNYSGIVLMAIQRLQTALSQIVLAIVFGIVVWTQQKAAGRNARILKFIQENRIQPER